MTSNWKPKQYGRRPGNGRLPEGRRTMTSNAGNLPYRPLLHTDLVATSTSGFGLTVRGRLGVAHCVDSMAVVGAYESF